MTSANEILEAMWEIVEEPCGKTAPYQKRGIVSKWRKILKARSKTQTRVILHVGKDHYLFSSDSRPGEFHSIDTGEWVCTCERNSMSGKECHHLRDMKALEDKGMLAGETQWRRQT